MYSATFFGELSRSFDLVIYLELILRILVAACCGALIGLERSHRFKDAGFRTHCLVAAASAMMMIVSKYGFADLTSASGELFSGTRGADAARIAAQCVSGISFLCAGVIYKDKKFNTKGLTTAAGIWAVSGIGLAIGSGMYVIGIFMTLFILLIQLVMHKHPVGADKYNGVDFSIVMKDVPEVMEAVQKQMKEWGVLVIESQITRLSGDNLQYVQYDITGKNIGALDSSLVAAFISGHPDILSMHMVDEMN